MAIAASNVTAIMEKPTKRLISVKVTKPLWLCPCDYTFVYSSGLTKEYYIVRMDLVALSTLPDMKLHQCMGEVGKVVTVIFEGLAIATAAAPATTHDSYWTEISDVESMFSITDLSTSEYKESLHSPQEFHRPIVEYYVYNPFAWS